MQIGNARLKMNKFGSDVPVTGLTPAEFSFLHVVHQHNCGGNPIEKKEITDIGTAVLITGYEEEIPEVPAQPEVKADVTKGIVAKAAVPGKPLVPRKAITRPRTAQEEYGRLNSKYGGVKTKKGESILSLLFPGIQKQLPEKFDDVKFDTLGFDGNNIGTTDMGTSGGAIFGSDK